MRVRIGVLIAVLAAGWLVGTPPEASARCPKDQREACRDCFDRTLTEVELCAADGLIANRISRRQEANVRYGVCAAQAPGQPGTCTATFRALNKCRRTRVLAINRSWTTFKINARRLCGRQEFKAANRARRQCLRDDSCSCAAPTTTTTSTTTTSTTTTTTTSTSTSSTATTTTTTTSGTGTTGTTTSTTTTTTRGSNTTIPNTPDGSRCQLDCIRRVARRCYSDCGASCRGDQEALFICTRACRNGQCAELRQVCVPGENTDFDGNNPGGLDSEYFACCKIQGECDIDDEDTLSCEPTTTITTTTTTSSTTTTTGVSTTTLFGTTSTLGTTTTTLPTIFGG